MTSNKTVFFDLGNVLVFFSHDKMYQQLARATRTPLQLLQSHLREGGLLAKYESGRLTTEEIYRAIAALAPHPFSLQEAMESLSNIFVPNYELWTIVERLKEQNTRLVLLSNTNESHFNYVYSHYPILKLFDHYVLSYQVGACKPEPLIFERALTEARGRSFYTDDIPAFVHAARNAGLDAEVYTDVDALRRHLQNRDMLV